MSFLKLRSSVINTSKISHILIKEDRYIINLNMISGHFIFGSGYLDSDGIISEFHKETDRSDYEAISKWIDSIK
jgi:hypothetical protein